MDQYSTERPVCLVYMSAQLITVITAIVFIISKPENAIYNFGDTKRITLFSGDGNLFYNRQKSLTYFLEQRKREAERERALGTDHTQQSVVTSFLIP